MKPDTSKKAPGAGTLRTRYEIDPAHASAQFKVRHLMVSYVRGELGPVSGYALIDGEDFRRSEVFASIDATGIVTRDAGRDEHLRGPDFSRREAPSYRYVSLDADKGWRRRIPRGRRRVDDSRKDATNCPRGRVFLAFDALAAATNFSSGSRARVARSVPRAACAAWPR